MDILVQGPPVFSTHAPYCSEDLSILATAGWRNRESFLKIQARASPPGTLIRLRRLNRPGAPSGASKAPGGSPGA